MVTPAIDFKTLERRGTQCLEYVKNPTNTGGHPESHGVFQQRYQKLLKKGGTGVTTALCICLAVDVIHIVIILALNWAGKIKKE